VRIKCAKIKYGKRGKIVMQRKISAMMLVLLFVIPMVAMTVPVSAVVGSLTGIPTKVIASVTTRVQLSGYGWTALAPFWYEIQSTATWVGTGTPTGWGADSAGAIPAGSYVPVTLTSNMYILLSQSADGTAGGQSLLITVVTYGPSYTLSDTTLPTIYYDDEITIDGEGFTGSSTVTIYFDLTVLKTTTADTVGVISDTFKIPDAEKGTHTVWVYDNTLGVAGEEDAYRRAYTELTMAPSLEADRLSIRGLSGESLVVTGHGFKKEEKIPATPAALTVAGVSTTHAEATVGANGRFSVTATLTSDVADYLHTVGFGDIVASASVSGTVTAVKAIIVSVPDKFGDELLKLDKEDTVSKEVGADVTIYLINFPVASVSVALGSKAWATITTDANGAGKLKIAVPETFGDPSLAGGYPYAVTASSAGLSDTATLNVLVRLRLYDTAGTRIKTSTYVLSGAEITVKFFGLAARTWYTITEVYDLTRNIVEEGKVTSITKGVLGTVEDSPPYNVKSNTDGSIELKYKAAYDDGTGATGNPVTVGISAKTTTFKAIRAHAITASPAEAATGSTPLVTLTFTNLIPARRYQVLFDGAVQTLTVGTLTGTYFRGDLLTTGPTQFTVPAAAAGVHFIDVVPYGEAWADTSTQARTTFVFSTVGGTATIWISQNGKASHTSYRYGHTLRVYGYNFDASESGVTVNVAGVPTLSNIPVSVTDKGTFVSGVGYVGLSPIDCAGGSYLVYIGRAAGKTQPNTMITVTPRVSRLDRSPTLRTPGGIREAYVGDTAVLTAWGLKPNTRYVILWDGKLLADTKYATHRFTTSSTGSLGVSSPYYQFEVPTALAGDHTLSLALESDPTTAISVSWTKSVIRVLPGFKLTPNPEAIMGQTVQLEWDISGLAIPYSPSYYANSWVMLDDMMVQWTLASTGVSVSGGIYNKVTGSIQVPNGAPDTVIKVTAGVWVGYPNGTTIGSGQATAAFKRVAGTGSLIVGVAIADDIAYIKGKVSDIAVSLSALDAKVVAINGTVATIDTKLGTMTAKLDTINATLVSIVGDVATIKTDLGTVKTDVAAIKPKITTIEGDVATIKTTVGTVKTDVAALDAKVVAINGTVATVRTTVGTISGDVVTVKGDVATIKTNVGTIMADVKDAKTAVTGAKSAIDALSTPLYLAVILALVAAVAAIASVFQISRKIAG